MIARRRSDRAWRWIAAAVVLLLVSSAPAGAQLPLPVTIAGEMLWVSGDRMMVSTRGGPVEVDLTEIPLDEYLALEPGAAVLVRGMWTEGDLLVASSLKALPGVLGPAGRERL